ncbi:MAG: hypothetical protein IJT16_00825 [Lachnospiraceae bacterium]|nr:hypothetical protein [Lachnospiraceae bacterium]
MSIYEEKKAITREKRVDALNHFNGSYAELLAYTSAPEIRQKVRTLTQQYPDEIIAVTSLIAKMKGAAVVIHGVAGCASSALGADSVFPYYATDLTERDTILGSDEKLTRVVKRAVKETNAEAVFILGTPVVAINNDDVSGALAELSGELSIPVFWLYLDGFKSKSAKNGYDILAHELLKIVAEASKEPGAEIVNLIDFSGEAKKHRALERFFSALSIETRSFPAFGSFSEIQGLAAAGLSVTPNIDNSRYFIMGLQECFQVPYIDLPAPIGLQAIRRFIEEVLSHFPDRKEQAALLFRKEEACEKILAGKPLAGKRVYLDTEASYLPGLVDITEALGATVSGIALPEIHRENRHYLSELSLQDEVSVLIAQGQPFEKANAVRSLQVDYYITTGTECAFTADQGAIPVSLKNRDIFFYEGIEEIVRAILTAKPFCSEEAEPYYRQSWLKKRSDWYVKPEVS